jgi:hypothetical protein
MSRLKKSGRVFLESLPYKVGCIACDMANRHSPDEICKKYEISKSTLVAHIHRIKNTLGLTRKRSYEQICGLIKLQLLGD